MASSDYFLKLDGIKGESTGPEAQRKSSTYSLFVGGE